MPAELKKIFSLNNIAKAIERDKTTIIKWEKSGKIPSAKRDKNGWRYYTEKEAAKIIKVAEKIKGTRSKHRKRVSKYANLDPNKILKELPAENILKHILDNPKTRQRLIERIIKDDRMHKQIIKLLVKSIVKTGKL